MTTWQGTQTVKIIQGDEGRQYCALNVGVSNQPDAAATCLSLNARLPLPKSEFEMKQFSGHFIQSWLDLTDPDKTGDVSAWKDIEGNPADYVNWMHLSGTHSNGIPFGSTGGAAAWHNYGNSISGRGLVTDHNGETTNILVICVQEIIQPESKLSL